MQGAGAPAGGHRQRPLGRLPLENAQMTASVGARGWRSTLLLLELGVAALAARDPVRVLRHEHARAALGAVLPGPRQLPVLELEVILLRDPERLLLLVALLLISHVQSPQSCFSAGFFSAAGAAIALATG